MWGLCVCEMGICMQAQESHCCSSSLKTFVHHQSSPDKRIQLGKQNLPLQCYPQPLGSPSKHEWYRGGFYFTQAGSSIRDFVTSGDKAPSYNICMEADLLNLPSKINNLPKHKKEEKQGPVQSDFTFGLCGRGRGWDDLGEWHWNMYNNI